LIGTASRDNLKPMKIDIDAKLIENPTKATCYRFRTMLCTARERISIELSDPLQDCRNISDTSTKVKTPYEIYRSRFFRCSAHDPGMGCYLVRGHHVYIRRRDESHSQSANFPLRELTRCHDLERD
jgi:hypothetical protein